ncbi:hypothetical protein ACLMJK_000510 [Lecanora helva]
MATFTPATSPDTPIAIKVVIKDSHEMRKFKLPLQELGASTLPVKLRALLNIHPSKDTIFERYSDSSSSYVLLDETVPSVYKQLYRAAKAKQKLRIRVTITEKIPSEKTEKSKPETSLPERLSTRRYVHPYISDPAKPEDELKSSKDEQSGDLGELDNPSSATLAAAISTPVKAQPEVSKEVSASSMSSPQKSYYWPMSHDGGFSGATKAKFEKKAADAKSSLTAKIAEAGAQISNSHDDRAKFMIQHADITKKLHSLRRESGPPSTSFTICCNNCEKPMPDAHWHCSICDMGDFDLCGDCVAKGHLCDDDDHWLIKRFVKDGKVIPSTTETIGPKKSPKVELEEKVPGAFTSDVKREDTLFDEAEFVTCLVCEDYDLCIPCHVDMKHGHHPSHAFAPASKETKLTSLAQCLCASGRNIHHYAICDNCDQDIRGVRHKCLNCPDFDYCSSCVKNACVTHPGHRLVPIYDPISMRPRSYQQHNGIYCDGPLCQGKQSYIVGDRYKCAVCPDTDFCATCEALPKPAHNRTHPLIKFKTPIRNVSVSTTGEKPNGEALRVMGDLVFNTSSKSTETTPVAPSANAATQVQTVAEVKPTQPLQKETKADSVEPVLAPELQALFIRDMVADGTSMPPSHRFSQVWVLRNPGPHAWPAGCCVCYIGGDSMLDVDPNHPSHINEVHKATKSNVIDRAVEVGEEVKFHVAMRTPERKGKAISYWRLKDATGLPFGHKLWCDVDVRSSEPVVKAEEKAEEKVEEKAEGKVETEHVEDVSKQPKVEDEVKEEQGESKMIFPKLDKESPASSTHEAQSTSAPAAPVNADEKELLEDVESLELDEGSDSDEAFLTDEEYELIASDDEFESVNNGRK